MTIAIGLIAKDGVVIAADRQETEGDQKKDQRKIDTLWAGGIGSLVVAGAGNGPYIDSMTTKLQYAFGSQVWKWSDHEAMTEKFRASHAAFYSDAVLPFAGYQPYERPDYELLFGCSIVAKHHYSVVLAQADVKSSSGIQSRWHWGEHSRVASKKLLC